MRAAAVVYVGNLERMCAFYCGCLGLTKAAPVADGYCELESEAWRVTLVQSTEAAPATTPAPRRSQTPVKLAFEIAGIDAVRPIAVELGGRVAPAETTWHYGDAQRCDCIDPEGNVIQLVAPLAS